MVSQLIKSNSRKDSGSGEFDGLHLEKKRSEPGCWSQSQIPVLLLTLVSKVGPLGSVSVKKMKPIREPSL